VGHNETKPTRGGLLEKSTKTRQAENHKSPNQINYSKMKKRRKSKEGEPQWTFTHGVVAACTDSKHKEVKHKRRGGDGQKKGGGGDRMKVLWEVTKRSGRRYVWFPGACLQSSGNQKKEKKMGGKRAPRQEGWKSMKGETSKKGYGLGKKKKGVVGLVWGKKAEDPGGRGVLGGGVPLGDDRLHKRPAERIIKPKKLWTLNKREPAVGEQSLGGDMTRASVENRRSDSMRKRRD